MVYIPVEVVSNILCRLPVKSLLRFRCVSKAWKAIIDSDTFMKSHRNYTLELKSSSPGVEVIFVEDATFYAVPFRSLSRQIRKPAIAAKPRKLDVPLASNDNGPIIFLGYCNGLFYLSVGSEGALWNPSTRKCHKLPHYQFKKLPGGMLLAKYHEGFGYDETIDDYKIVNIRQPFGDMDDGYSETAVYSLKSNCWRRIKDFPGSIYSLKEGTFAFGALHWLAYVPTDEGDLLMVLALDLETEEYEPVPLPQCGEGPYRMVSGTLHGCFSMTGYYESGRLDIWLMKERRNAESWVKLLSIVLGDVNVIPVAYSRSGRYVLLEQDKEKLMWYDLRKKAVKRVRMVSGPTTFFRTFFHLGSLVHFKSGVGDEVSQKMGQVEMKQNKTKRR